MQAKYNHILRKRPYIKDKSTILVMYYKFQILNIGAPNQGETSLRDFKMI